MMRIAFTIIGGQNWTGGQNYLLNLLGALTRYQPGQITPVLFINEDCDVDNAIDFSNLRGLEIVRTPLLNAGKKRKSLFQAIAWGRDIELTKLFHKHRINLVFEVAQFFGWRLGIPALAWITDFQHKALPHLFTQGGWWKREIGFRMQVAGGRNIMLSSEDAKRTCEHYYPSTRRRTRVVNFAVPPGIAITYPEARAIADSYGLPEHFIFLPNQFWQHKNHGLVLKALIILRARGKRIVIAASGKQLDGRNKDYFPAFLSDLERHNLQQEFKLLGLIPYTHLSALMRACVAMLNPSLFEGWSTTVEEARALGTPMVLSDLDVHREQMGEKATYFDRSDAASLADALENLVVTSPAQREELAITARLAAQSRVEKFAADFVNYAELCIQNSSFS